jgi:hypothetical protein
MSEVLGICDTLFNRGVPAYIELNPHFVCSSIGIKSLLFNWIIGENNAFFLDYQLIEYDERYVAIATTRRQSRTVSAADTNARLFSPIIALIPERVSSA